MRKRLDTLYVSRENSLISFLVLPSTYRDTQNSGLCDSPQTRTKMTI